MTLQNFVAGLAMTVLIAGAAAQSAQSAGLGAPPGQIVQPPPPPPCPPVPGTAGIASISDGTAVTAEDIQQFNVWWMSPDTCAGALALTQSGFSKRHPDWDTAARMTAMTRMYELTQDLRYLYHLRQLIEVILFYRDDHYPGNSDPTCKRCEPTPVDDFRGGIVAGWGHVQFGNLSGIDEDTTPALTYPIATFARIVAEDPSLQAEYGSDAIRYANAAMETMWSLMPQMNIQSVGSHFEAYLVRPDSYRTKLTQSVCQGNEECDNDHDFAGAPLDYNGNAAFMMTLIELWRALDSPFYRSTVFQTAQVEYTRTLIPLLVSRFQRFFADHLQTRTDDPNGVPRFYWNYNDGIPHSINPEGTPHGSLDMQYIDELRRNLDRLNAVLVPLGEPIVLDASYLWQFANTFLWKIAGGAWEFGLSVFAKDVTGKNPDPKYNKECAGWVNLAVADGDVYSICHEASLRVVNGGQPYLTIGAHSALLMNKQFASPVSEPPPHDPHCGKFAC